MGKEGHNKYILISFLIDVGNISPFSYLTFHVHLKQGNLGFNWNLVKKNLGDLHFEGSLHCDPWNS